MPSQGFALNEKAGMGLWAEPDRDKQKDTGGKGRSGEERQRGREGMPNRWGEGESQGIGTELSRRGRNGLSFGLRRRRACRAGMAVSACQGEGRTYREMAPGATCSLCEEEVRLSAGKQWEVVGGKFENHREEFK